MMGVTDPKLVPELERLTQALEDAYHWERNVRVALLRLHAVMAVIVGGFILFTIVIERPRPVALVVYLLLSLLVWGVHLRAVLPGRGRGHD